jgi:hypothetical protein
MSTAAIKAIVVQFVILPSQICRDRGGLGYQSSRPYVWTASTQGILERVDLARKL